MAKKKGSRIGYGVKPPYINLKESLEILRRIYDDAGGTVSNDQLSRIVGNTVGSSSFGLKIQALKNYGLVAQDDSGRITLSDLGRRIAAPIDTEQRSAAIKEAFLKLATHKTLFDIWAGRILPAEEFFLNTIRERCDIPSELTKRWRESFMESGRAAGLFQERPDGKIQLRLEPDEETIVAPQNDEAPAAAQSPIPARRAAPAMPLPLSDVERFQIPLTSEGKVGVIELPKGWTQPDVKKMIHVIEAMFLWNDGSRPT